jgi:hypothetical protein
MSSISSSSEIIGRPVNVNPLHLSNHSLFFISLPQIPIVRTSPTKPKPPKSSTSNPPPAVVSIALDSAQAAPSLFDHLSHSITCPSLHNRH